MSEWNWQTVRVPYANGGLGMEYHLLVAKECQIEITPRPSYCDRGRWECHVVDPGFPTNPRPTDFADMFPRLFFLLERAKAEMEDWMNARKYTPVKS